MLRINLNPDRCNPDGLLRAERYAESMACVVQPYLAARRKDRTIPGDNGRSLFTSTFTADHPRGTVLIVHGFTENVDKYAEVIHSLLVNGFCVLAYDQRGHGRSWRADGVQDISLTHVDRFEEYVSDMEIVCDGLLSAMPKPWLLFAHSMGGAVSSLYLEKGNVPFERAALCAPMIAPNRGGIPFHAARAICLAGKLAGKAKGRMPTSQPYSGPENFDTSCATGRERFDWYEALRVATPAFQNNGPSFNWTLEALNVTAKLLSPGAPERIAIPVRLYTAERDESVLPEFQKRFIARVPHGERVFVKAAKHEIYRSEDAVLYPWWHDVLTFLKGE